MLKFYISKLHNLLMYCYKLFLIELTNKKRPFYRSIRFVCLLSFYFLIWYAPVFIFIIKPRLFFLIWLIYTYQQRHRILVSEKKTLEFEKFIWELYEPGLRFLAFIRGYRKPLIRFTKNFDLWDYYAWNHYIYRGYDKLYFGYVCSLVLKFYGFVFFYGLVIFWKLMWLVIFISKIILTWVLPTLLIFSPFAILLLIINSLFIFIFKKWLGPVGVFYNSILILFIFILLNINTLFYNLNNNTYIFIDFGRWFFTTNLIDSHLIFCFDNLTIILSIVVSFLTILAQFFGVEYMAREAFITRLVYLLNLFATSVILLFCVYDFFLILIAWECIGLFSFLLVNFYSTRIYTIKAALKTFIFSRISDMFIFITFNLTILVFNSTDLTIIFCKTPFFIFHSLYINTISINFVFLFTITLSLASCIKGAQFFFHVWLPDAMEAPTPASALIHSSTLVIMGIYLIIRFGLIFEFSLTTNYFLTIIGGLTIAFGAVVASFQNDIKKLVAYSTISQMGYLICGCGFCAYDETVIYLIMHACNKAFLFILVGYTVHFFAGNTDMRQMGGSYLYSYDIVIFFLLISFNLIGLPYGTGFYSKEFLLFQVMQDDFINYFIRGMWFVSFCFTPFYMFILSTSTAFWNKKNLKWIITFFTKNLFTNINYNSLEEYYKYRKNEQYFSTGWSFFTSIFFFMIFIFLNIFGEYFTLIIFNITTSLHFNIIENFLTLKINKNLLITLTPNFVIETLFIFVVIGLYLSIKTLLSVFLNKSNWFWKKLFFLENFSFLLLIFIII